MLDWTQAKPENLVFAWMNELEITIKKGDGVVRSPSEGMPLYADCYLKMAKRCDDVGKHLIYDSVGLRVVAGPRPLSLKQKK